MPLDTNNGGQPRYPVSSGQSGRCRDSHLIKVGDIFEFTKACTNNRSVRIGTAAESHCNRAWSTSLWQGAQEHVRNLGDLEVIRCFPKESDSIPTARAKLSPNPAYNGLWSVGKFKPQIQISGPPVVGPRLGTTLSITKSSPSAVS